MTTSDLIRWLGTYATTDPHGFNPKLTVEQAKAIVEKYRKMEEALQSYRRSIICPGCAIGVKEHTEACEALSYDLLA